MDEPGASIESMTTQELLAELRANAWATLDFLDSGVFAPSWVGAMTGNEMVAAHEPVGADLDLVRKHDAAARDGAALTCCSNSGSEPPCAIVARAIPKYRRLRAEPGTKPTFMATDGDETLVGHSEMFKPAPSMWDGQAF